MWDVRDDWVSAYRNVGGGERAVGLYRISGSTGYRVDLRSGSALLSVQHYFSIYYSI